MSQLAYQRKTKQFDEDELKRLEGYSADELVIALIKSTPVIALRGAAEVFLNGDSEKIKAMLANSAFNFFWRQFKEDRWPYDSRDEEYAVQLESLLVY